MRRSRVLLLIGVILLTSLAACDSIPGPNSCPVPVGATVRTHPGGHNLILEWKPQPAVRSVRVRWEDSGVRRNAIVDAASGQYVLMQLHPRRRYALSVTNVCADGKESEPSFLPATETVRGPVESINVTVPYQDVDDTLVLFNCYGETLAVSYVAAVTRQGDVFWAWAPNAQQQLPDVNWSPQRDSLLVNVIGIFTEMNLAGDTIFTDRSELVHHGLHYVPELDAFMTMNYRTLQDFEVYSPRLSEGVRVIRPDGTSLWDWHLDEHIDPDDFNAEDIKVNFLGLGYDWTHANDVNFIPQRNQIAVVVRNLDRILFVDYPSGKVTATLGSRSALCDGIWSHPHEMDILEFDAKAMRGRFMLFDNGNYRPSSGQYSRAIEVEVDEARESCEVVWEYREKPDFFDEGTGAAYRLPNGNTLITDGFNGRVLEVESSRRVAWEMKAPRCNIYQAKPVPRSFFERAKVTVDPP
jgi:hypothetical protein